jgi:hypothetical protein
VKPGELVKIVRSRIGVPEGTIGLILKIYPSGTEADDMVDIQVCPAGGTRTVRRLERDLEVISASR